MSKTRVGVLRGGTGGEYDVSLKTGARVMENLPWSSYLPYDIFIDRKGEWHFQGLPKSPEEIAGLVDVVWNGLHGAYGEGGGVQEVLEIHKIPYTGSSPESASMTIDKMLAKGLVKKYGIRVPYHQVITREEYLNTNSYELFRRILMPVIIKPIRGSFSLGTSFAQNAAELWEGVGEALEHSDVVLLEQYVRGREVVSGVLEGFRDHSLYPLIPVEIKKSKEFVSYEERIGGTQDTVCPARLSREESEAIRNAVIGIHKSLGLRHYTTADFIVSPKGIYFLEIDSLPSLAEGSSLSQSLKASGATLPQFLDHVIKLALDGK
ncbi:MAG: ATP-grasp domain-containing protein [Candidatus Paceibacterota bacterium]|jgi:D-alanine-D-alanine ligase